MLVLLGPARVTAACTAEYKKKGVVLPFFFFVCPCPANTDRVETRLRRFHDSARYEDRTADHPRSIPNFG